MSTSPAAVALYDKPYKKRSHAAVLGGNFLTSLLETEIIFEPSPAPSRKNRTQNLLASQAHPDLDGWKVSLRMKASAYPRPSAALVAAERVPTASAHQA
jgi:hypothetical protein